MKQWKPVRPRRPRLVHPPGLLERFLDRVRGREQLLVRPSEPLPLLLLSFPRGQRAAARDIESVSTHTFGSLSDALRQSYAGILRGLPSLVVVILRRRNPCGCLGHHHPRGAESRLTRRLSSELGSVLGEIDLACEGIREWRPLPLSSLAAGSLGGRWEALHFQAATLAVLLHELEHLASPDGREQEIRARSNSFYAAAMQELVAGETGGDYGMAAPSPRP